MWYKYRLLSVCDTGEATLTDALTAAGKTYEEIAEVVAQQVKTHTPMYKYTVYCVFSVLQ